MTERDRLISELDDIMRRAETALQRLEARQCTTDRTPVRPKLTIVKGGLIAAIAVCGAAARITEKARNHPGIASSAAAALAVVAVSTAVFVLGPERDDRTTDLPGALPAELTVSPPTGTPGGAAAEIPEQRNRRTPQPSTVASMVSPAPKPHEVPTAKVAPSSSVIPVPRQPAAPQPSAETTSRPEPAPVDEEREAHSDRGDTDENRKGSGGRDDKYRNERVRCLDVEPNPAVDRNACDSAAGGR
ncbi:hypothetical protein [Amycolatopsis palatopharyngis]|uniref:hypothetical protein n=1 Tax=Amycolatopsis palatopharyngis TaxID=187982 RepID=UPI000E266830|nr:hypothetical protein [Amycolatopsis palatopharyngis]